MWLLCLAPAGCLYVKIDSTVDWHFLQLAGVKDYFLFHNFLSPLGSEEKVKPASLECPALEHDDTLQTYHSHFNCASFTLMNN